jgi:hypothetical protein
MLAHSPGTGTPGIVCRMNDDEQPQPADQTAPLDTAAPPRPGLRDRLRGRTFRLRSVVAVTVAALVVGGGAGTLVGYVAHGDGHGDRPQFARIDGSGGQPGGQPDGRRLVPPGGQLPPATVPDQDGQPEDQSNS